MKIMDAHSHFFTWNRSWGCLYHCFPFSAYHQFRDLTDTGFCSFSCCCQLSVSQDGNVIRCGHYLVQTMGNKDNGNTAFRDLLHNGNKLGCLTLRKNSSGFIKHQKFYTCFIDLSCDLDKLHISNRHSMDQRFFI